MNGLCSGWKLAAILSLLSLNLCLIGCGGSVNATPPPGGPSPAPVISLSSSSVTFGNQVVNSTSAPQTVTVTNTGDAALAISGITVTGDFALNNTCGTSVAAGSSCTASVTFTPTALGSRAGGVTVTDNATGSPHQIALSGTGVGASAPAVSLSPAALTFGSQALNTASAAQTVTLTNTGNAALTISTITVTGDFAQTNTCATSVAAGASCAVRVTFTPTAVGTRSGTLSITDSATGSPHQIAVSGTGVSQSAPAVSLSPAALTFGSQVLNTASAAQTVTLTNTGNAALTISGITVTGDFAQTNTCATSVAAGASCAVRVTFTPTAVGTRSGTLSITDSATGSPHQVAVSGTGVSQSAPAVSLSPAALTFGSQALNTASAAQTVTLTNTGNAALTISTITVTGDFAQTNTCATSVAAGAGCAVRVTFTPTAVGTRSGTLSITDNATGSPHRVTASGTGVAAGQVTAAPSSVAFGSVTVGSTNSQNIVLSNSGGTSLTISSASTSGPGFSITGLALPVTLTAGQNATFSVNFAPSSSGAASGSVSLTNNGTVSPLVIALAGTGVAAVQHSVTLTWDASTSTVAGYNIYRADQAGGPYTKINTILETGTIYTDSSVASGRSYYYIVTAIDSAGAESLPSNEAVSAVPSP